MLNISDFYVAPLKPKKKNIDTSKTQLNNPLLSRNLMLRFELKLINLVL